MTTGGAKHLDDTHAGKCVGFPDLDLLVLWPAGTHVAGSGDNVRIKFEDSTFPLGYSYGISRRVVAQPLSTYPDLANDVPDACRDFDVVAVDVTEDPGDDDLQMLGLVLGLFSVGAAALVVLAGWFGFRGVRRALRRRRETS